MDKSRTQFKPAIEFVFDFEIVYFNNITQHLGSFVEDGFLKTLFEKNPSKAVDKAQLLIEKFGEAANPANFTAQAQATNIQPTTLSLIYSIALYTASQAWYEFNTHFYRKFGDMGPLEDSDDDESQYDGPDSDEDNLLLGLQSPKLVVDTPPILPDVDMTPVDQTVIPENFWKKDKQKQKERVTDDKQVKNQSTTAKPDAQTSAKNSQKEKKSSIPEATQILTGYEAVGEEQERI